jgi:DDE family transposase
MRPKTASEKKGGRKKASLAQPGLLEALEAVVENHTAGSPVDETIRWTNRSPQELAEELAAEGFQVSDDTVRRLLTEELELSVRQALKDEAGKDHPQRNEQFEHITRRRAWYAKKGWPIVSIDTKKKELLGDFWRGGRAYTDGKIHVLDHDFASQGHGRLVPYGVYDVERNEGYLRLSLAPDTSETACDALEGWWERLGRKHYWHASGLLVLCDCGGSNGNRQYRFKEELHDLACYLRRPIEVAHYPPGCSKYNLIEHRLFCHVSRALRGVVLRSMEIAQQFIERTSTATGLQVLVETTKQIYQKGLKASREFLDTLPILFNKLLPEFNYTALPFDPYPKTPKLFFG